MRITGGDEQMADWMVELIRAARPDDSGGSDSSRDGEPGQPGQVIEFPQPLDVIATKRRRRVPVRGTPR
jgi:hypothetical protein